MHKEEDLLDNWKLREWLDNVTEDIDYHLPISVDTERSDGTKFSDEAHIMRNDRDTLETHVARLESEFATWIPDR